MNKKILETKKMVEETKKLNFFEIICNNNIKHTDFEKIQNHVSNSNDQKIPCWKKYIKIQAMCQIIIEKTISMIQNDDYEWIEPLKRLFWENSQKSNIEKFFIWNGIYIDDISIFENLNHLKDIGNFSFLFSLINVYGISTKAKNEIIFKKYMNICKLKAAKMELEKYEKSPDEYFAYIPREPNLFDFWIISEKNHLKLELLLISRTRNPDYLFGCDYLALDLFKQILNFGNFKFFHHINYFLNK